MPIEIQLDDITRSSFEADVHGIRYLQAGAAKNIDETDPGKILARLPHLSGVDPLGAPISIPQIGQFHKVYPQCMVTGYRVTGIGHFDVQFFVVYESPAGYGLNFIIGEWYPFSNNTVGDEETWIDADDQPIIVYYRPPGATGDVPYLGSARKRTAYQDLMLTGVFLEDLTDAQNGAVGRTNDAKWWGKPKGTWLCTGCVSRPEILGYSWRKTATFSNNPRTWDAYEKFVDKNTGHSPTDISGDDVRDLVDMDMIEAQATRNGVTRVRVQKMASFKAAFGDL